MDLREKKLSPGQGLDREKDVKNKETWDRHKEDSSGYGTFQLQNTVW